MKTKIFLLAALAALTMVLQANAESINDLRQTMQQRYAKPADSLKLKAAEFLLDNAPRHWAKKGELMDLYLETLRNILSIDNFEESSEKMSKLVSHAYIRKDLNTKVCDTDILSSDFLSRHIDRTFMLWQQGEFARHLNFDQFCEFLLPYRVGEEQIEDYFDEAREEYAPCLNMLEGNTQTAGSAYWAAQAVFDQIHSKQEYFKGALTVWLSPLDFPYSVLKMMRMGKPIDYAALTAMVLRACGIPSAIDFAPWPQYADSIVHQRKYRFTWNAVLDNNGRLIPFCGGIGSPSGPR